jgi:hypothetical protein
MGTCDAVSMVVADRVAIGDMVGARETMAVRATLTPVQR